MIILAELNPRKYPTNPEIDQNLNTLLTKLNGLQALYKGPIIITSGLRSQEQQEHLISTGRSNAHHSKHLYGAAADLLDRDSSLRLWIEQNIPVMIELGLYMEDFRCTPQWVHVQIFPPASGKRFFLP